MRAALASLLLTALLGAACSDLQVKMGVFNRAEDARAAGAVAAGWLPEGTPASATELRIGYLPDGRHWGVFAYVAADEPAVRALIGDEITSGTLECQPPGRLEFWPRILLTPINVERVRSTGFRVYRGRDARIYAINWGQARVYYWRS